MITYNRETISTFIEDAMPLLRRYWGEADERRESTEMSLDLGAYTVLEEKDMLRIYTASEDGDLVGFTIFVVSPCVHTGCLKASSEISYIEKQYRGASLIDLLFLYAELELAKEEVSVMVFTLKTEFPHENLVERAGFKHVENIYLKEILLSDPSLK